MGAIFAEIIVTMGMVTMPENFVAIVILNILNLIPATSVAGKMFPAIW